MANTCISFPNITSAGDGAIFPTIDTILPSFTAAFRIPPEILALRGIKPQSLVPNIPQLPTVPAPGGEFPTMCIPSIEQAYAATGTQMALVLMIVDSLKTALTSASVPGLGTIPDIPMPPIPGLPAFGFDDLLAFDPTSMLASLRGAFDPQKLADLKGEFTPLPDFKGEFQSLLPTPPTLPDLSKLQGGSPVNSFQSEAGSIISGAIGLDIPGLPLPLWPTINPPEWSIYATLQHAIANYMALMTANVMALITVFQSFLDAADPDPIGFPAGPIIPTSFPDVAALMPPGIVPDINNPEFTVTYTQLAAKVNVQGLTIQALTEYVQTLPIVTAVIPSMSDIVGLLPDIPDFCAEVPDLTFNPPGGFDPRLEVPDLPIPDFPIEVPELPEL